MFQDSRGLGVGSSPWMGPGEEMRPGEWWPDGWVRLSLVLLRPEPDRARIRAGSGRCPGVVSQSGPPQQAGGGQQEGSQPHGTQQRLSV